MPGERPRTSRPRFNNGTSNNLNRADESYRDISVQTGEEFSADFLRERVSHRAASADMDEQMKNGVGFIVGQNHELVYEDLSRILGIRRRDSDNAPEVSEFYQVQKNYDFAPEIRNHRDYRFNNDIQPRKKSFEIVFSPTGPPLHSSDSPSSQQPHYGLGVSDGSSSGKVKCLCSFGGKIIPRPSDGKLRYIGGETRIMSIRRNATFSELMKKTCAICNQLHTIRYQLPGEDLDALITVSSDNDLHLMIEEFRDLDKFSQRLRIFLISLNESDGGSSSSFEGKNLQPNEGDYHYMNAPNGMSSSRESLPSPSQLKIHELDSPDNPNLQMYDDHPFGGNFMYTNNQREYKNPYFDATGYYYSNPVNNVPAMNYQNQNNFFAELELGHDLYPQNHVQGSEFPPLPLYGDFANDRPVHNCFTYFSTKSTFSEKKNDHFSGSDIPIEDCHEQSSDAQLQLDTTMSGLSQDLVMQKLETGDEKYQKGGKSVNMLKFTMNNDQSMEYIDWGKTTINWMGKKESNDREGDEDIKANANIRSCENSRSGVRIVEQEREARKSSLNNAADQSPGMVGFEPFFTNQGNAIPFAEYESCLSLDWHENDRHMIDLSLPSSITAILGRKISNKVETEVKPTSKGSNFVEIRQSGDRKHVSLQKSTFNVEDVTNIVPHDVASSSKIVPYVHDGTSDGSTSPKGSETESETGSSISKEFNVEIAEVDGNGKEEAATPEVCIAEMEADFNNLQIIKNVDLEEQQELGSGTYGTVYHGKWRGTDVAIKRIRKSCFAGGPAEKERLIKDFWREANILSKLHHPNVLAFYGVVPDGPGGTLATVTEYMVNGSLRHVLLSKEHTLDRRKKLLIALDAAFGMEYLHMKNIVHFDLKCDNLLVNLRDPQRPICKVGDLGLSRIKHNTLISGGVRGTLPYMAPELLTGNSGRVSEKVDVFSFGIALWEILTGEEPYANMHCGAIIGGILSNKLRPTIPENCNPDWRKLMEECWSGNPTERPSFTEITNRLRAMTTSLQPKRHNFSKR